MCTRHVVALCPLTPDAAVFASHRDRVAGRSPGGGSAGPGAPAGSAEPQSL